MRQKNQVERPQPDLLTVQEFARRLSISVWTARAWAYSRRIASVKVGTRLHVPASEVARVISENLRPAQPARTGQQGKAARKI